MGLNYAIHDDVFDPDFATVWTKAIAPKLAPATILSSRTGERTRATAREADMFFVRADGSPALKELERQLDETLGQDNAQGEDWQFVRYGVGGHYAGHFDWFAPKVLERPDVARAGQRTWTALFYLVAPTRGGETRFPLLDLNITPKVGRMLLWNNLDEAGKPNPWAFHEALPVLEGEKWIMTRWYREKCFQAPRISSNVPATSRGASPTTV